MVYIIVYTSLIQILHVCNKRTCNYSPALCSAPLVFVLGACNWKSGKKQPKHFCEQLHNYNVLYDEYSIINNEIECMPMKHSLMKLLL